MFTAGETSTGPAIAPGATHLGSKETAFDGKVAAVEAAVGRHRQSQCQYKHLVIHSDSIARASDPGRPRPKPARDTGGRRAT